MCAPFTSAFSWHLYTLNAQIYLGYVYVKCAIIPGPGHKHTQKETGMVRSLTKFSRTVAAGAALMLALAACGSGDADTDGADGSKGTIKVGGTGTSFPHSYMDGSDLVGFDTEVITIAAERAGYDVEFQTMDFPGLMGAVTAGRIDTTGTNLTWTEDRGETYVFTRAYAFGGVVIAAEASNDDIQTEEDLAGKTIGTGAGSTNEAAVQAWIEETGNGASVRPYDGPAQAQQDTLLGRVDGYAGPIAAINAAIAKQDMEMKVVTDLLTHEQTRFPFADTERGRQLAEDISASLAEMEEDGTLAELSEKYFGDDLTVPGEDNTDPDPTAVLYPGGNN